MYVRMHNELATKLGSQINTIAVYSFLVLNRQGLMIFLIVHAP